MHQPALFLISLILSAFLASACSKRENGDAVVSSKHSQVFHSPECEWASKIKKANRRTFPNSDAAIAAGLKPCKVCAHLSSVSAPKLEPNTTVREFKSLN
jgi:methylphosphotriester-DNA--protein-cysteine methyltransferase